MWPVKYAKQLQEYRFINEGADVISQDPEKRGSVGNGKGCSKKPNGMVSVHLTELITRLLSIYIARAAT